MRSVFDAPFWLAAVEARPRSCSDRQPLIELSGDFFQLLTYLLPITSSECVQYGEPYWTVTQRRDGVKRVLS